MGNHNEHKDNHSLIGFHLVEECFRVSQKAALFRKFLITKI